MPALDEEIEQAALDQEQEQQQREEFEAYQQQQRFLLQQQEQQRFAQQQSQAQANPIQKAQNAIKWGKRLIKIGQVLGASFPVWGPILLILVLVLIVGGAFYVGCNNSMAFRLAAGGTCKAFISGVESVPTGTNTSVASTQSNQQPLSSTDSELRALLLKYGITVNNPCTDPTRFVSGQTCLMGMQYSTIYEVINFSTTCDAYVKLNTPGDTNPPDNRCGVRVTGGSEPGHAAGTCSHSSGYKIDLGVTAAMDRYITTTNAFTRIADRGSDPQYVRNIGKATYARESNHWDIVVACAV